MLRSILAVILGYLAMAVPIIIVFSAYVKLVGNKPTISFMILSLFIGLGSSLLGGFTAASIATADPMMHAAALAGLGFLMWLLSAGASTDAEPIWYRNANMLVMLTGVLWGGSLV